MSIARVREAYSARAAEYISRFGSIEAAAEQDREYVLAWARAVNGPILDVGCGPGQWTNHLHESGADIEGVDPVAEFIKDARQRYPRADYRIGHADRLGVDDASLGGLLAWFSLIHHEPDRARDRRRSPSYRSRDASAGSDHRPANCMMISVEPWRSTQSPATR